MKITLLYQHKLMVSNKNIYLNNRVKNKNTSQFPSVKKWLKNVLDSKHVDLDLYEIEDSSCDSET